MRAQSHQWRPFIRRWQIPCCRYCGLLRLQNRLTEWCIRKGCDYEEHPEYLKMVRALGRPECAHS